MTGQEAMLFMLLERVNQLETDKTPIDELLKHSFEARVDNDDRISRLEVDVAAINKQLPPPLSNGGMIVVGALILLSVLSMTAYLADTLRSWLRP